MREPGFYWVRYEGKWEPAEWDGSRWWLINMDCPWTDAVMDQIGPRITPPGEEPK